MPTTASHKRELDSYIHDVSKHPLLTAEQEQELGKSLLKARQDYWCAALSFPPWFARAVDCGLDEVEQPTPQLKRRITRDRKRAQQADGNPSDMFLVACAALAKTFACASPQCRGAETMARAVDEALTQPSELSDDPDFRAYARRVRRAKRSLVEVRERFVRANLRLVVRVAARFYAAGLTLRDRIQEGNLGLIRAVERFDPSMGFRFSTYAVWWIKHAIRRAVVNGDRTVRIPAHLQTSAQKLAAARVALRNDLAREPTEDELAQRTELTPEKIRQVVAAITQHALSLDVPAGPGDLRVLGDTLVEVEDRSLDERIDLGAAAARMRGSFLRLNPMEQDILRQRFGLRGREPRTLTEIGAQYGVSRERIRQLQLRALRRMRGWMENSAVG